MNLAVATRYTYRCPLARLNAVRWTFGCIAAALWFRVGMAELPHSQTIWHLVGAVVATLGFGITSAGMWILRPRRGILGPLTDWYGIVASVITWTIGSAAIIWNGISWIQGLVLFAALAAGITWLGFVHFGLYPIHLGAIERE